MPSAEPMLLSQRVVQVRLCLVGAIAIFGGALHMVLGQPETAPRLDNINRFMGGVSLMSGVMGLPEPHALWITYLVPELVLPWIIIAAQVMTNRQMAGGLYVGKRSVSHRINRV